ncbi:MAG: tight adherence protein [Arthrobacter sp.]
MTAILIVLLALASWLAFPPQGASCRRAGTALASTGARISPRPGRAPADRRVLGRILGGRTLRAPPVPMTVVVQQLAALLRGGRRPARLWDELWLLYGRNAAQGRLEDGAGPKPALAPESVALLAAARAAALRGASVAEAIRSGGPASPTGKTIGNGTGGDGRERRVWGELAACFDIAEASGCPLADVLTRFAAQLEAEDDAEAARQTALAGPKATARLLTWLPLLGLGLGTLLGVDPVKILLQTPSGMAALAAGVVLTAAGRVWSSQLVRAAGAPL